MPPISIASVLLLQGGRTIDVTGGVVYVDDRIQILVMEGRVLGRANFP
jgi:hypothetical protein